MGHQSVGTIAALGAETSAFALEVGGVVTFNLVVVPLVADLARGDGTAGKVLVRFNDHQAGGGAMTTQQEVQA